jgi:hypothetical protein
MKTSRWIWIGVIMALLSFSGCDEEPFDDLVPDTYFMVELNPDDVYMYNAGNAEVRLDPLLNDSLKVNATVSYSTPLHGTIRFIQNEGWFYNPDEGFFGIDNIIYTVCHAEGCGNASITMYVEEPLDPETCMFEVNGESAETLANQPVEIRIFSNDIICQYLGMSINSPEKGTFTSYSYSGSYKNTVYVYFPPKDFKGTDQFKYRIFTPTGYLEATCEITVK